MAQNYSNHSRFDPVYHFFTLPVLFFTIIVAGVFYAHHRAQFSHSGVWFILLSVALLVLGLKARMYALKNQDRIIRLEERLRLREMCSESELAELESLTMRQYVGLRFASNAELPGLARRAVREKLTAKQIKQAVNSWRADEERV